MGGGGVFIFMLFFDFQNSNNPVNWSRNDQFSYFSWRNEAVFTAFCFYGLRFASRRDPRTDSRFWSGSGITPIIHVGRFDQDETFYLLRYEISTFKIMLMVLKICFLFLLFCLLCGKWIALKANFGESVTRNNQRLQSVTLQLYL